MSQLEYICDNKRHLICRPYSITGLHAMAQALGINRCWFHGNHGHNHYDIPKLRIAEVSARCTQVSSRELLLIIKANNQ